MEVVMIRSVLRRWSLALVLMAAGFVPSHASAQSLSVSLADSLGEARIQSLIVSVGASPVGLDDWRRSNGPALPGSVRVPVGRFLVVEGEATRWSIQDGRQQQPKENTAVLVVPGFVYEYAVVGDDNPTGIGGFRPTIGVQIRGSQSGSRAWVFEGSVQPSVGDPHFRDERIALVTAQVGRQIGRGVYVRPSAGVSFFIPRATFPVGGVAIGRETSGGTKYMRGAEFVIRTSLWLGFVGVIAGLQVPIG
jgi:hypothetical protein